MKVFSLKLSLEIPTRKALGLMPFLSDLFARAHLTAVFLGWEKGTPPQFLSPPLEGLMLRLELGKRRKLQ